MGLDINFFKSKKSDWKKYQEECDKFANLSDEEINRLLDERTSIVKELGM